MWVTQSVETPTLNANDWPRPLYTHREILSTLLVGGEGPSIFVLGWVGEGGGVFFFNSIVSVYLLTSDCVSHPPPTNRSRTHKPFQVVLPTPKTRAVSRAILHSPVNKTASILAIG